MGALGVPTNVDILLIGVIISQKLNAFQILNVLPTSTREEISNAREDMLLDGNLSEDSINRAESAIIKPITRLQEELSFFWGMPVMDNKKSIGSVQELSFVINEYDLPGITKANIAVEFCSQNDIEDMGDGLRIVELIAEAQKGINASSVTKLINAAREKAKVVPPIDEERVEEYLRKLRNEKHKKVIVDKLFRMSTATKLVTGLAEKYQFERSPAGRFVCDLIRNDYKNWIRPKLPSLEEKINMAAKELEKSQGDRDYLQIIERNLREWDRYVQPIQLVDEGKGFNEEISFNMCERLRGLAVCLHNERGETEVALDITRLLLEAFRELPQTAEKLENDLRVLEDFKHQKRKSWWKAYILRIVILVGIITILNIFR